MSGLQKVKMCPIIQAHRKVCLTSTHYVKVDDLLTEKAVVCDGRGERGATETNNLVCTKKQKHIYGNSTHETTRCLQTGLVYLGLSFWDRKPS